MIPPTSIDGTDISGATIDGQDVQQITVDGQTVFTAGPDFPFIIDNFEDAPNGPYGGSDTLGTYWTVLNYSINDWDRSTINPIEDNKSLRWLSGDEGSQTLVSFENDGLPNYPEKGQIFSAYVRTDPQDNNPTILFGLSGSVGSLDCYGVRLFNNQNEINILKGNNDSTPVSSPEISTDSVSIPDNTIFELEVEWHDGSGSEPDNEIVYTVHNVNQSTLARTGIFASISANDSDHASNKGVGFGFSAGRTSTKTVFDGFKIIGTV